MPRYNSNEEEANSFRGRGEQEGGDMRRNEEH